LHIFIQDQLRVGADDCGLLFGALLGHLLKNCTRVSRSITTYYYVDDGLSVCTRVIGGSECGWLVYDYVTLVTNSTRTAAAVQCSIRCEHISLFARRVCCYDFSCYTEP